MVALVEPFAPAFGALVSRIAWREGYLSDQAVQAQIVASLQPLDLVLVSSKGRLSGHTIPGLFQHAAVYLGSERQLRALGMWSHPSIARFREQIRTGARFVEADQKGVHLSIPSTVLNTDRVVILRPRISTPGWKIRSAATLLNHVGERFDFNFDASDPDRLFCTELVCHAIPELRLARDDVYGRPTILPDRVVFDSIGGSSRLRFISYVVGSPSGLRDGSRSELRRDLDDAWPRASIRPGSRRG